MGRQPGSWLRALGLGSGGAAPARALGSRGTRSIWALGLLSARVPGALNDEQDELQELGKVEGGLC